MKNLVKYLTAAAVVVGCSGSAFAVPTGPALELMSGASANTVILQDNALGDLSAMPGAIIWSGSINGWSLVVTTALTKPNQGSATMPNMDLSVTSSGNGGLGNLTVLFTDTDFGPSAGLVRQNLGNNGTSTATYAAYYDTGNAQFAETTHVDGSGALTGPYSITLSSIFTPGSISSDQRVTTVPDGGATVMLLGAALSAMGLLRRKLIA